MQIVVLVIVDNFRRFIPTDGHRHGNGGSVLETGQIRRGIHEVRKRIFRIVGWL